MRNLFKIAGIGLLFMTLILNLHHALAGYHNKTMAYADESAVSASGSNANTWTKSPYDCSLTISGTVGASYNIFGQTGVFGVSGAYTYTATNAATSCSTGGSSSCTYMNCSEYFDSIR